MTDSRQPLLSELTPEQMRATNGGLVDWPSLYRAVRNAASEFASGFVDGFRDAIAD